MAKLKKFKFEDSYRFTVDRFSEVIKQNRYFYMRPLSSACDDHVVVRGKEYIMFGSNNYLGLSSHPKVVEAAIEATKKYGTGTGGSRISTGNLDLLDQLEVALAELKGTEDAIVYNSGFLTNVGLISAMADTESMIFSDKKNHASLIDGCELSKAHIEYYAHNDMDELEKLLQDQPLKTRKLIVTDGIFSMDGDILKLPKLVELSQKYNAMLMVDDAHATGVLGETGGGTAEHFGMVGKVEFEMGTLSKAIGGAGGFVATKKETVFYLRHASRQFIFSTALPPSSAAAALAAIKLIRSEPERRQALQRKSQFMREELNRMGYKTGLSETQIIPVLIGEDDKAYTMTRIMEENGIYVLPAVYPVVRKRDSRIRLSIMATHKQGDLVKTLEVFNRAGKELCLI